MKPDKTPAPLLTRKTIHFALFNFRNVRPICGASHNVLKTGEKAHVTCPYCKERLLWQ